MAKTERPELSLDELLLDLQLISVQQLNDIRAQAARTGLPLNKTLVLSNVVNQANMERLLKLQAIHRGCRIPKQLVIDAYRCSVNEGLTIEQGLAKAGVFAQIVSFSRLGLLLVDAKLITKKQLDEAQKLADETRFPLGKTLTMQGAISQAQLMLALDLQKQMRERKLTKDEALAYLAETTRGGLQHKATVAAKTAADFDYSVNTNQGSKNSLVELLVVSGIITEHDADAVFELSMKNGQKPEVILKESNLVPESLIPTAIELQEAIMNGDLNVAAAAETLNYIANYALQAASEQNSNADS